LNDENYEQKLKSFFGIDVMGVTLSETQHKCIYIMTGII